MSNQAEINNENLIHEFLKGNEAALEYIYDSYSAALYGIILKVIPNQELGRDLLQECMVKIWQKRMQYDSNKGTLFTWMLNLTRNHCIDYLRSKRNKNEQKNREIDNFVYRLETDNKFEPDHLGVNKMLDVLPEEQRQIIDLAYFQGYTQKEISEEFDIPLGTVKSRAKAALDKLRNVFKEDFKT